MTATATQTPLFPDMRPMVYGRKSGACAICGRALTAAVSVALGIGPVCDGRGSTHTKGGCEGGTPLTLELTMLAAKDMVLDFRAAGADGYCRARLYNGRERPVVLLSQLAETGGPSMAKAIEFIIPQASELLGITPETNPAFVEHYDSRSRTFRPMDGVTFDLVEVVNGRIAYKHLGTEGMEKLVGIPALNELIEQHCLLQAAR